MNQPSLDFPVSCPQEGERVRGPEQEPGTEVRGPANWWETRCSLETLGETWGRGRRFSGYSGNKMLLPSLPWVRLGLLEISGPQGSRGHEGGTTPHLARSIFSALISWALTLAEPGPRRIGCPFPWPKLLVEASPYCPLPGQRPAVQRPGPGAAESPPACYGHLHPSEDILWA